jgi:glutamate/tyrosine decarboxylase-like PLP-dependent enzyme
LGASSLLPTLLEPNPQLLYKLFRVSVKKHMSCRHCPEVKSKGNSAAPGLCAFTSDEAHYSYQKSCSLLGLGSDNLVAVGTDPITGAMDPEMLRTALFKAKEEGRVPFFVGATSGSTVIGAFDRLDAIAQVVREFNEQTSSSVWLHVDGSWGGATLLSAKHKYLMKGVELTDSYSTNPHKLIGAPLQCAFFITKHNGLLREVRN